MSYFILPRATGVRPTACHPLRSWPASARAATVSATLRPALAGRAADRCIILPTYIYILLPTWPTVSRVRSSLAPLYCILTGTVESAKLRIVLWTPLYLPLLNVFMHLPWAYTNPHGFCPYKYWSELLYGVFSHSFLFMYGRRFSSRYSSSGKRYRRAARRVTRPMRSTRTARRSLGLKSRNSPSVNRMSNYLYRVVLNISEDICALAVGALVTTN